MAAGSDFFFILQLIAFTKEKDSIMKKISFAAISLGLIVLCMVSACKKNTSPWNNGTALTASLNGQSAQYVAPAGIVNYGTYQINGYESNTITNTIQFSMTDSPYTRSYSLAADSGNAITIVNNGNTFTSAMSGGGGVINLIVNGKTVTGNFSGTLVSTSAGTLSVTNGAINTTY